MTDVDRAVARAGELLNRLSPQAQRLAHRARQRRRAHALKKFGRIVMAGGALLIGAVIWGLAISPLGSTGLLVVIGLFLAAALLLGIFPQFPESSTETLINTDIKYLPAQTEVWIANQRKALPAPAQNQLDQIGLRLETLGPQLQAIDPREPAAQEIRKILAEHLPELVNGYKRVPEPLRREKQSNGQTPDEQLVGGLKLIDEEIAEMTRNIAAGDLDKLATQGKFLELKYRDPDGVRG